MVAKGDGGVGSRGHDEPATRVRELADQIPCNIDFGFCAVGQPTERTFKISNLANIDIPYSFEKCPFEIEPKQDVVPAKGYKIITISYTPSEATVVVASTILTVEGEKPKVVKFSAIGKFPFLKTQNTKMDFGEVLYGKKHVKELVISNASEVATRFNIKQLISDDYPDTSFSLDVTSGVIPPKSAFLVKVLYKPMVWDLFSCTHYEIQCQGGNKIQIQCAGKSLPIEARLSSRLVNFQSVPLGQTKLKKVTLHNHSESSCTYEIVCEHSGVFSISKEQSGTIQPKSYATLMLQFTPQKCINYYQRVYVLVRNHLALHLDLLGNCYDLLVKPPPLNPQVIKEMRLMFGGPSFILKSTPQGELEEAEDEQETVKQLALQSTLVHKEIFGSNSFNEKYLVSDSQFVEFGFGGASGINNPSREVTLKNKGDRRLSLFWTSDATHYGGKDDVFNVHPAHASLGVGETMRFTITFKPLRAGAFYCHRVQCFAIDQETNMMEKISKAPFRIKKKMIGVSNLTQSSIPPKEIPLQLPPIELAVVCSGHSFSPDSQPFIPMLQVLPKPEVIFSPVALGDTAYCSIQLLNKTDTPCFFKFDDEPNKSFEVFPRCGVVDGHKFKLIFFKFSPNEPNLYHRTIHCRLNNSADVLRVHLTGFCCVPRLEIDNKSQMFFPPAFLGVHAKQKIGFHNKSRIPLSYTIAVPYKYNQELLFSPTRNTLFPNQTEYVMCSLMPLKKKRYQIKVPVEVFGEYGGITPVETQQIEVYGEGGDGSLVLKPDSIDFGIIKVNFQRTHKVTIYNHSHVTFFLQLTIVPEEDFLQEQRSQDGTQDSGNPEKRTQSPVGGTSNNRATLEAIRRAIANSFQLDFTEGLVTGHSKVEVAINFKPVEVCELKVRLVCIAKEKPPMGVMIPGGANPLTTGGILEKCSIGLKANGRFPILKIVDIRNEDLSVSTLWDNFKLDKINSELLDKTQGSRNDTKDFEDLASSPEKEETIERSYHEWNFGYLQNKPIIEPRRVVLTVQNVGGTDLEWKFKFPNDNQINAEPWADPGEQSEKEAYEKMILEKKIFEVYPREGILRPNQKANLQLIYSPNMDEEIYDKKGNKEPTQDHKLRVILMIENGKSCKLLFRGKTLAHLQAQLSFSKDMYLLPALPIGMLSPVVVPIQMENVGSGNINTILIEESEIQKANRDNGAAKVFDVQLKNNAEYMQLFANKKKPLFIEFKPAEAKEYNFWITVKTRDLMKELEGKRILLRGWGYDPNVPFKSHLALNSEMPRFKCSHEDELSPEAYFSIEELDFGELSSQESVSRIFLVYNNSRNNCRLRFEFEQPQFVCKDSLTVTPQNSMLNPGEHAEIKVTIIGSATPSIYEGELECKVYWLDLDKKGRHLDIVSTNKPSKVSAKNEGSSMPTPKSSVDRLKLNEKLKDCKTETLFMRLKKKSKIDIGEQRENLRLHNKASKAKDESSGKEDVVESVYSSIMTRAIRDVLGSEQAVGLVDEINSQYPRLFCFFDRDEPIRVNDMQIEEHHDPHQDHLIDDEDDMDGDQSHGLSQGPGEQYSAHGEKKPQRNSNSLIKENTAPLEKAEDNSKGVEAPNPGMGSRVDKPALISKGTLNLNKSLHLHEQKSHEANKVVDSSRTQLIQNVPGHLSPNDLEEQNVSISSPKKLHSNTMDMDQQARPGDDLAQVIIRDEFKTAAQNILDEAFLSIIKDAISGKINLNERETQRTGTMSRVPMHQLRSQMSIRPENPMSSQSNIRT